MLLGGPVAAESMSPQAAKHRRSLSAGSSSIVISSTRQQVDPQQVAKHRRTPSAPPNLLGVRGDESDEQMCPTGMTPDMNTAKSSFVRGFLRASGQIFGGGKAADTKSSASKSNTIHFPAFLEAAHGD